MKTLHTMMHNSDGFTDSWGLVILVLIDSSRVGVCGIGSK